MKPFFSVPQRRDALLAELGQWAGTPFAAGTCRKGVGVDCVRFAVSCLQAVGAIPKFPWPEYTVRGAGEEGTRAILRVIRDHVPNVSVATGRPEGEPLTGDVWLAADGAMRHFGVIGSPPDVWHADIRRGVHVSNIWDRTVIERVLFRFRVMENE